MLEMIVRTVDLSPKSGSPMAMLLPRDRAAGAPLTLPIRASEACTLSHELEGQTTPRARAYSLLLQALATIGGYVAAIVVEPGEDDAPSARVRVCLPDGWSEHRADTASALGLAIHTMLPLHVSEQLAQVPTGCASGLTEPSADASSTVPAPFLRALDD
jgi:bifunctional DNase/RNase